MELDEFIKIIEKSTQHQYLYHFTDETNLVSINERGLASKSKMRSECWWPNTTGGNALSQQLDTSKGIDFYVSLCFTPNHGMAYLAQKDGRLPNPKYLRISPEVLRIEETKIALGVANASGVEILSVKDAIDRLDVEVIYTRTDWSDSAVQTRLKTAEKFEILVPNEVPRALIVG